MLPHALRGALRLLTTAGRCVRRDLTAGFVLLLRAQVLPARERLRGREMRVEAGNVENGLAALRCRADPQG